LGAVTEFLLQILASLADPVVLGVGILTLSVCSSRMAVRAAMAGTALFLAGLDVLDASPSLWDVALLGGSLMGGLLAAQLVLWIVAPAIWLGLQAMRSAIGRWRCGYRRRTS